jgi:4,5-dihydroxyphthalate decarboxylase
VSIKTPASIRIDDIGKSETLDGLLEDGRHDALAVTAAPRGFRRGSTIVRRLFPMLGRWKQRTTARRRFFPIMHLVVIRRAVYDQHRRLATALAKAFQLAKQRAYDRCDEALYPLPWLNLDLEYARQLFGEDIYPYGVKQNLPTLEAATLFSYEQGLTERRFRAQ